MNTYLRSMRWIRTRVLSFLGLKPFDDLFLRTERRRKESQHQGDE